MIQTAPVDPHALLKRFKNEVSLIVGDVDFSRHVHESELNEMMGICDVAGTDIMLARSLKET